jgi:predicted hydrocarbon binding protein/voltage-gated potassium channel Kch
VARPLPLVHSPAAVTLLVLVTVILVASGVYMMIERWSFLTALIFTLATVTTVGYGNVYPSHPAGEIFTAALMMVALGVVVVALSTYASRLLHLVSRGADPMEQNDLAVAALRDHVIVIADENMASALLPGLRAKGLPFVAVTAHADLHARWLEEGHLVVLGNPEDEEVLQRAGVERALGLIAALPSDAENVFVALSAHELNPRLRIAARAHSSSSIPKLRRSGADEIVLPDQVTAMNLASLFQDRSRVGAMVRDVTEQLRAALSRPQAASPAAVGRGAGEASGTQRRAVEGRPEDILFRAVRLALQELSPDMEQTLFALGEQFGREAVAPNLAGGDLCQVLEKLGPLWGAAGLGSVRVVECSESAARLEETRCSTCQGMPNVGKPVCHLERGVLNGAVEASLGRTVRTRETKCWGLGDHVCEFEITADLHRH